MTKISSTSSTTTSGQSKSVATRNWRPVIIAGVAVGVVVVLALGVVGVAYGTQAKTIVRSSSIAGTTVGGLDTLAALNRIQPQWNAFTATGFQFTVGDKTVTVPIVSSGDESVTDLAAFDVQAAVDRAYAFGHSGSLFQQAWQRLSGFLGRRHEFSQFDFAGNDFITTATEKIGATDALPVEPAIALDKSGNISVVDGKAGHGYDMTVAARIATNHLTHLDTSPIVLTAATLQPTIPNDPSLLAVAKAESPTILDLTPITLKADADTWTVKRADLVGLLGFEKRADSYHVTLDVDRLTTYFTDLKKSVDTVAENSRFKLVGGKVQEFSTSNPGREMDVAATVAAFKTGVLQDHAKSVTLVTKTIAPVSAAVVPNDFGIADLVGTGTTNFSGSPANRRYNLTLGASKLDGLLIKPGETFSLVAALGEIDAAHGWKPELVIKGPKITPEFGGGLCQVATTLFRAVLNAGLPVTERHNHSLRIHYYEPPVGLDATIYDPQPDLRFTNDYGHYLLLQTAVSGNTITFSFYGTKDGRTVDLPTPKVYNYTAIPKTQNIETTDLKPGEKKCQTPGHPGADATATYTVTYADGHSNKQIFQSHYRALGVICQVGVKAKPKPKPATNTNTSTNTNAAPTNTNTAPVNTNAAPATNTNISG